MDFLLDLLPTAHWQVSKWIQGRGLDWKGISFSPKTGHYFRKSLKVFMKIQMWNNTAQWLHLENAQCKSSQSTWDMTRKSASQLLRAINHSASIWTFGLSLNGAMTTAVPEAAAFIPMHHDAINPHSTKAGAALAKNARTDLLPA